jgi:Arc/MetJ family transcription regulator
MRTNIVLNDELLVEAMKYSHARSKRGLVEEALATYVAVKDKERRRATYSERLKQIQAQTQSIRLRSNSQEIVRQDRASR